MKLLYITNGVHGSGGLERVLAIKASYLVEYFNYEVTILTLNSEEEKLFYEFSDRINFFDVNTKGKGFSYLLSYRKGIIKAVEKIKPDVISVCDDGFKGIIFGFLMKVNVPKVYERHASVNLNLFKRNNLTFYRCLRNYLVHKIMLFGAKKFDRFVILTEGNKFDWKDVSCTVIPNPAPFRFKETKSREEKFVLAVGSQTYNKGYDRLIEVWKIIEKKHPDWSLKIFGKKDERLQLEERVNYLGLHKIYFNDPICDIEKEYEEAAIFALPSRSEGFGMVLIEAMSFGVPCVSFDCPHGPADIIRNNEDGFLIEDGNIEHFANALVKLIKNKELRLQMGMQAKKNMKRYAPEKVIPVWDKLFKSLIK